MFNCSDKNWLEHRYIDQKKSAIEIAEVCGCSIPTVYYYLRKFKIPRRNRSECLKGKFTGPKNPNWKGGRIKDKKGYIKIYSPEHPRASRKYVLEHILVAEKMLGRSLKHGEVVHHISGVKDDNRPENLWVAENIAEHRKAHSSINKLLNLLLDKDIIYFDRKKGEYNLLGDWRLK